MNSCQPRNILSCKVGLHGNALAARQRVTSMLSILLLLLLSLNEVGSAKLRDNYLYPNSPKTPAPQYQPIDRKERNGKIVEGYSKDGEA